MNDQNRPTPQRLFQMAFAYSAPLMIEAAVKHKVFDALDDSPKTAEEVARQTNISMRGARALLNGLIALDLLSKDGDKYALTPESAAFLVTTKPSFQGGIFRHASTQLMPNWMQLSEVVKTGAPVRTVNEQDDGSAFFGQFVEDIFPMSYLAAQAFARSTDLGRPTRVLDIAAGSGVWGIALAQASPDVRVTAVDWSGVLPVTKRVAQRFGVAEQFEFRAGDINEVDFGSGYDIATLGHILHSEGETQSRRLLKKVHDALAPGGTICIAEMVANADRTGPPHALVFAVNMLVNTEDGDTFSFEEISTWLREAGFENPRELDAPGPSPLIVANKTG